MHKAVKGALITLGALALLVVGGGLLMPREYAVERSLVVEAEPEAVYALVADLEANQVWSPWKHKDPSIDVTYGDKKVGPGASYSWTSEDSGIGSLTIAEAIPNQSLTTALDFDGTLATGHWSFEPAEGGTKVTWGISGDNGFNPIARWFGLAMDSLVGADFELGLERLAATAEGRAL